MNKYSRIEKFREDSYSMLVKSKDATFELMDSIMTMEKVGSVAQLSLSPFFRRQWHSTYEAIEDCRLNSNKLMKRCIQEIPPLEYILLGIDHTPWAFRDSPTMKDRTYQYSNSSSNSSVIGQGYSTIAWLPPLNEKGSWALPLRHERITSFENPLGKGTWQLRQVCRKLPENKPKLVVLDCEYGNGKFIKQTADIEISKLIRVRSNLCLYGNPPPYSGRGRPKKHGAKLKLNQCDHFPHAHEILEMEDSSLGTIRMSKWEELHFYNAPSQKLTLFKIERLKPKKTGALHRPLWLIWVGEQFLSSSNIWIQYSRRFGVDHWYRFAKQRLHWTLPRFRTPESCQRWSNLIVNITWQLWLSKDLVKEYHLPWQKPQQNLTPGRVAQSMISLLMDIGSPTLSPKSRGKSHGWPKGRKRNKAKVYPTVKKRLSKTKKRPKK